MRQNENSLSNQGHCIISSSLYTNLSTEIVIKLLKTLFMAEYASLPKILAR